MTFKRNLLIIAATLTALPAMAQFAKPEIWKDAAKFKEAGDKLQAEATKLNAAAKTGNLDNLKTAFAATGGTCKGCHDNFRKD